MKNVIKPKDIILLYLCLICTILVYGQKPENTLNRYHLNGAVKSVESTYYNAKDSVGIPVKAENAHLRYDIIYFNQKGYGTQQLRYKKNNLLKRKLTMTYDEKGNAIKQSDYGYKGRLDNSIVFEYDSDGRLVTERHNYFTSDGSSQQAISKLLYNTAGELIEKNDLGFGGRLEVKRVYRYVDQGELVVQLEEYNSEGELRKRSSEYRNKTKKMIDEYFTDGAFSEKITTLFNAKNRIIEKTRTDSDTAVVSSEAFTYDSYGSKIEEVFKGQHDEYRYTYSYEYDKYNNWTKQITIEHNTPNLIVERVILYY